MQAPNKKAAPFSFHRCVFYLSSLSLISKWILRTWTFISSHVVTLSFMVHSARHPSGKRGDWGWDKIVFSFFPANNGWTTVTECCVLKALFLLVWHTEMSSVFATGPSMNSMAWKLVKWAKFVLVLTNTHMLKNRESSEQNFEVTVAHNCHGKKKNLMAKRITRTSRQKK